MKRRYFGILAISYSLLAVLPSTITAQKGPNMTDPDKKTKTVRGCEYEVLPGLAEITSVTVVRTADQSALKYDEHEVLFKFTPMEGDVLLEMLQDKELEFVLRSAVTRIPVGPEYLAQKKLKVGTKYAMNLLQTQNKEACLDRYTYESKVLDNDLFEAEDNIIPYIKSSFEEQQIKQEQAYLQQKNEREMKPVATTAQTTTTVWVDENIDVTNMTPAQMITYAEEKIRRELAQQNGSLYAEKGINIDSLTAEAERKMRDKYNVQLHGTTIKTTPENTVVPASKAIQDARKEKAAREHQARLDAKQKEQEEKERQEKIAKIQAQIEADVEAKIQAEIEANRLAAEKQQDLEKQQLEEKAKEHQSALLRLKAIEDELKTQLINEQKRKECVFGERISGTIEIVNISKAKEASESYFKYTEFQVVLMFRPDNYSSLSKKDQKQWDTNYTFTLDPTGVNANPGANYIRKYKVMKSSKYQGFAQSMESGVCNSKMFYSPDLPIDAAKVKLQ